LTLRSHLTIAKAEHDAAKASAHAANYGNGDPHAASDAAATAAKRHSALTAVHSTRVVQHGATTADVAKAIQPRGSPAYNDSAAMANGGMKLTASDQAYD